MMRNVVLYGELAKKYGRKHALAVNTPAEAVRALDANFPTFVSDLIRLGEKGYGYRVIYGSKKEKVGIETPDELLNPVDGDIRIIPEIVGAKRGGIGQILMAVVLVAASVMMPAIGASIGMSAQTVTTVSTSLMGAGISMAIGGVIQLLSPQPKSGTPEEKKNNPSYLFDGPINTMAQGHPVPVCYGEMIVGSAVISAGIEVDQIDISGDALTNVNEDGDPPPTWVNPDTGLVEDYPAPTLAWDYNRDGWVTADNKLLSFDNVMTRDSEASLTMVRQNWRTSDGRVPVLTPVVDRWDIENPNVFAKYKKQGSEYFWYIGRYIKLAFNASNKRFEIPLTVNPGD